MSDELANLIGRLQRLEDAEEIQRLVCRYAWLCDNQYDPDGIAALFTEDADWSSASVDGSYFLGRCHGKDEIHAFFSALSTSSGLAVHYVMAPQLNIDSREGTGSGLWYTLVAMTRETKDEPSGESTLLAAKYEQEYRRVEGRWLFSRVDALIDFHAPVHPGWTSTRFVEKA